MHWKCGMRCCLQVRQNLCPCVSHSCAWGNPLKSGAEALGTPQSRCQEVQMDRGLALSRMLTRTRRLEAGRPARGVYKYFFCGWDVRLISRRGLHPFPKVQTSTTRAETELAGRGAVTPLLW